MAARVKGLPLARARLVIYLFNYLFKASAQLLSQKTNATTQKRHKIMYKAKILPACLDEAAIAAGNTGTNSFCNITSFSTKLASCDIHTIGGTTENKLFLEKNIDSRPIT